MHFNNRCEQAEETINELKDRSVEIIQVKSRIQRRKINRAQETCGVPSVIQIYAQWESQRERKKNGKERIFE